VLKTAVVVFPGSNCEADTERAVELLNEQKPVMAWHKDPLPNDVDLVVIPGGFSYGDYLRAGAIARFSPVMQGVIEHAKAGGLVLGICNGFQILLEAGLLPGAMMKNSGLHFTCEWVHLRTERHGLPFTQFEQSILKIPVAHATGNYYAEPNLCYRLEEQNQIVFRYCDENGNATKESNPNGSLGNIAGICNETGNVLGMMPHPERAISQDLGSSDGALIWKSLFASTAHI
jgi:phosphoribosylformylglycinamidine synthase